MVKCSCINNILEQNKRIFEQITKNFKKTKLPNQNLDQNLVKYEDLQCSGFLHFQ